MKNRYKNKRSTQCSCTSRTTVKLSTEPDRKRRNTGMCGVVESLEVVENMAMDILDEIAELRAALSF